MTEVTHGFRENLSAVLILDNGFHFICRRIGLNNAELTLHALLVLGTILTLDFLIVLNRFDKLFLK